MGAVVDKMSWFPLGCRWQQKEQSENVMKELHSPNLNGTLRFFGVNHVSQNANLLECGSWLIHGHLALIELSARCRIAAKSSTCSANLWIHFVSWIAASCVLVRFQKSFPDSVLRLDINIYPFMSLAYQNPLRDTPRKAISQMLNGTWVTNVFDAAVNEANIKRNSNISRFIESPQPSSPNPRGCSPFQLWYLQQQTDITLITI